jgi:hypothetical protein
MHYGRWLLDRPAPTGQELPFGSDEIRVQKADGASARTTACDPVDLKT